MLSSLVEAATKDEEYDDDYYYDDKDRDSGKINVHRHRIKKIYWLNYWHNL